MEEPLSDDPCDLSPSKSILSQVGLWQYTSRTGAQGHQQPTAQQLRQVIIDIRQEKLPDPQVEGNAGSFFMNPIVDREKYESLLGQYPQMPHYHIDEAHEKIPAGWLIDQCGWKGRHWDAPAYTSKSGSGAGQPRWSHGCRDRPSVRDRPSGRET